MIENQNNNYLQYAQLPPPLPPSIQKPIHYALPLISHKNSKAADTFTKTSTYKIFCEKAEEKKGSILTVTSGQGQYVTCLILN